MDERARPLYRIRDWAKHFENNESRKRKRIHWVPIPNNHDGYFYRRTMEEQNGMILYAAWIGILAVASKCEERGTLARHGVPLESADICRLTGMNRDAIEDAIIFFSQTIDAIEVIENLPTSAGTSARLPKSAVRTEQNRTEQNRREQNRSRAAAAAAADENSAALPMQTTDASKVDRILADIGCDESYRRAFARRIPLADAVACIREFDRKQATIQRPGAWARAFFAERGVE
jgi:hypothetical protein